MEDYRWQMIQARNQVKELQERVDKAVELLKMDNPDIERVLKILEGKEK